MIILKPSITYFKNPAHRDRITSKWRKLPIKTAELTTTSTSWDYIVFSDYQTQG